MPTIKPFAAVRYARRPGLDFSTVIAPPYDVLTAAGKAALQTANPHNIVTVDFPHPIQKQLGPPNAYADAAITLRAWLNSGVLVQDVRPALYPYTQVYDYHDHTFHRRAFFALVKLSPFGEGHVV